MSPISDLRIPTVSPRRIVLATLVVVAVGIGFWLFYRYYQVGIVLFAAIIVSTAVKGISDRLTQRGLPRLLSVILVYGLLILAVAGFFYFMAPVIANQSAQIASALPDTYEKLRAAMLSHPNFLIWRIGTELPASLNLSIVSTMSTASQEDPVELVSRQIALLTTTAKGLLTMAVIMSLAFYWTLYSQRTIQSLMMLVPLDKRATVREFVVEAESKVGGFVRGQTILCLIVGGMALIAYGIIGLPYALLLAVVAGITEAIPLVGPILGALPAVLVAYSVEPTKAIWVALAAVLIQQIENLFLVPRVMNHSVGVHPLLVLLILTSFGLLFGVPGALVAIPFAAVLQLAVGRHLLGPSSLEQGAPPGRDELSKLRYETGQLVQDIRRQIRQSDTENLISDTDHIEDLLEAIATDLDSALAMRNGEPSS
ncbi:MAG: AI-2E family transporter [Candidatus Promineifilaceae bacterium]